MTNMTENDESMPEENTFSEDEVQTVLKEKQQQESASQPLPQDNLTTPGSSQSTKTPIRNRVRATHHYIICFCINYFLKNTPNFLIFDRCHYQC